MSFEVYGKVIYKTQKLFKIKILNDNKLLTGDIKECIYPSFFPIELDDIIYGKTIYSDDKLKFTTQPLVQLPLDKESILKFYVSILKDFSIPLENLKTLFELINDEIDMFSMDYIKHKSLKLIKNKLLQKIVLDDIILEKLLTSWYFKRIIRRLYLFGLTNKEIKESNYNELELYNICNENPYKIYSISLSKVDNILESFNKKGENIDIICGTIVRKVYELRAKSGWVCVPFTFLQKIYKNLFALKNLLTEEYGLVFEGEYVYLNYSNIVENTVFEFISNKLSPSSPPSPLEEGEEFICSTLTEEQKNAIRGVFKNEISIITGGPGCGKCLDPNTKILMYDGDIKKIKDINVGEYIKGDDSTPRKVLCMYSGIDDMYKIVPKIGYPFICNRPHILTLKGAIPEIISYPFGGGWIVKYTEKGIYKKREFNNIDSCNTFYNSLYEDIYDISLEEYLTSNIKRVGYIIHTSVQFPVKKLDRYPYLIGYELDCFKPIDKIYKINSYNNRLHLLSGVIDKYGIVFNKKIYIKF